MLNVRTASKKIEGESKKREVKYCLDFVFMFKAPDNSTNCHLFSDPGLFFSQGSSSTFAFQPSCCHRGWQIYLFAHSLDMQKWKHVVLRYHYSISDKMHHDHRGTHRKPLPCDDCASNLPQRQAHTRHQSVSQQPEALPEGKVTG